MSELILEQPLNEAREMVVEAFKKTDGINKYQRSDYQVVGKTGITFPRVLWSYGESVYVDLSETNSEQKTKIVVDAEKDVQLNIGGNAQKFKRRFLHELKQLRENSADYSEIDTETKAKRMVENSIPTVETEKKNMSKSIGVESQSRVFSLRAGPLPTDENKNEDTTQTREIGEQTTSDGAKVIMIFVILSSLLFLFAVIAAL